ncbi:hypothetical protein SEPCBS119000_005727 [Sporothrix epigloea]|uniref:Uncharacterized protein n=1 Tax=Sporothrix epigloea TaxID=1892477 RepID=A0ABP0E109_9PEZI
MSLKSHLSCGYSSNEHSTKSNIRSRDEKQTQGIIHVEGASFSEQKQGSLLHEAVASTTLPPHIRMLPPHLRAEGKLRWEASQREAAAAAEKLRLWEKQRQDRLLKLRVTAPEDLAVKTTTQAASRAQEQIDSSAYAVQDSTDTDSEFIESAPKSKESALASEDSHLPQNGQEDFDMRLLPVSDDQFSTSHRTSINGEVSDAASACDKASLTPPYTLFASTTFSNEADVGSVKNGSNTRTSNSFIDPTLITTTERNEVTRQWVFDVAKYGSDDWYGCTFKNEDTTAAKTRSAQRHSAAGGEADLTTCDNFTELSADRQRLYCVTDSGKSQRPNFTDMTVNQVGRLHLGAVYRSKHSDGGPMEPTGALYNLRMRIVCNFARQCRSAEHSASAIPAPAFLGAVATATAIPTTASAESFAMISSGALSCTTADVSPARVPISCLETTSGLSTISPPLCRRCARSIDFVMCKQHSRMFLESVLLPLSECSTYSDVLVHVNTCVSERVYAESGMDFSSDNPEPGALRLEDIETKPLYKDYKTALTLATHRQRVLSALQMAVDDFGFLYCQTERG